MTMPAGDHQTRRYQALQCLCVRVQLRPRCRREGHSAESSKTPMVEKSRHSRLLNTRHDGVGANVGLLRRNPEIGTIRTPFLSS